MPVLTPNWGSFWRVNKGSAAMKTCSASKCTSRKSDYMHCPKSSHHPRLNEITRRVTAENFIVAKCGAQTPTKMVLHKTQSLKCLMTLLETETCKHRVNTNMTETHNTTKCYMIKTVQPFFSVNSLWNISHALSIK